MGLNNEIWREINAMSPEDRRQYLQWHLQAREPIKAFSDIKVGDHLVQRMSLLGKELYHHHFLCIEITNEGPVVIHYTNTPSNAVVQMLKTSLCSSGATLGQLGIIQEMSLPNKDFLSSESDLQKEGAEVERVVWPEELKRFSQEEIVRRARRRKDEKYYDLGENNCESFVMWCLCDLNISLQVTSTVSVLVEAGKGLIRTTFQGLQQVFRVVVEKVVSRIFATALTSGFSLAWEIALIMEAITLLVNIKEAWDKWQKGELIRDREGFIKEIIDAVTMWTARLGGSYGGMILGQLVIPVPVLGDVIGVPIGMFAGHCAGAFVSKYISKPVAHTIDVCITAIETLAANIGRRARNEVSAIVALVREWLAHSHID